MIESIQMSPSKELSKDLVLNICKRLDAETTITRDLSPARYLGIVITFCHSHEADLQTRCDTPKQAHLVNSACSSLADMETIRTDAINDADNEENDVRGDHESRVQVKTVEYSCNIVTSTGTIEVFSGEFSDCSCDCTCTCNSDDFLSSSPLTVKNEDNNNVISEIDPAENDLVHRVHINSENTHNDVKRTDIESPSCQSQETKSGKQKTPRWRSFKTKLLSKLRRRSKTSRSADGDSQNSASSENNSLNELFENSCRLKSANARLASTTSCIQDASELSYRSQYKSGLPTSTQSRIKDAHEPSYRYERESVKHVSPLPRECIVSSRTARKAGRGVPDVVTFETEFVSKVKDARDTMDTKEVTESGAVHPLTSVIRDRLIQWKKRPKRKFKLTQLMSCTRS